MSKFLKHFKKYNLALIFVLILSLILSGCQESESQAEIELAEQISKIEESYIELENKYQVLEKNFSEYKERMEPYEELQELDENLEKKKEVVLGEISSLTFLSSDEKDLYCKNLDDSKSIEDCDVKLDEAISKNTNNKNSIIEEYKGKVNSLTFINDDDKTEYKNKINNIESRDQAVKLYSNAEDDNNKLEEAHKEEQARKEEEAKKQAAAKQEATAKKETSQSKDTGSSSSTNVSQEVLITRTGKRYHKKKCGNGTYFPATLSEAQSRGLTPCKKCF